MGSRFDLLDPRSAPASRAISAQARANRTLLREAMARRGFRGLGNEWWHFTLAREPYPATYFDFPVE